MDCNPQGEGDYNMPRFKQTGPKVAPRPAVQDSSTLVRPQPEPNGLLHAVTSITVYCPRKYGTTSSSNCGCDFMTISSKSRVECSRPSNCAA